MFALGSAATARGVVGQLLPWLFLVSLGFLGYAHYLAWSRHHGHRFSMVVLLVSTVLVAYLWYDRVRIWWLATTG